MVAWYVNIYIYTHVLYTMSIYACMYKYTCIHIYIYIYTCHLNCPATGLLWHVCSFGYLWSGCCRDWDCHPVSEKKHPIRQFPAVPVQFERPWHGDVRSPEHDEFQEVHTTANGRRIELKNTCLMLEQNPRTHAVQKQRRTRNKQTFLPELV